jgi:ribosomal protein S18 acetylase RimI-like enzyme
MEIILLPPEQWQPYKEIRLEALKMEPQAFGSSYTTMLQQPDTFWQGRLAEAALRNGNWLLFARENDRIIGMIGAFANLEQNTVSVISVYVTPQARGKGVSKALMRAILEEISQLKRFQSVSLTVNKIQAPALHLYQHFGFKITREEDALMGDGNTYTEYHMEKQLDPQ